MQGALFAGGRDFEGRGEDRVDALQLVAHVVHHELAALVVYVDSGDQPLRPQVGDHPVAFGLNHDRGLAKHDLDRRLVVIEINPRVAHQGAPGSQRDRVLNRGVVATTAARLAREGGDLLILGR